LTECSRPLGKAGFAFVKERFEITFDAQEVQRMFEVICPVLKHRVKGRPILFVFPEPVVVSAAVDAGDAGRCGDVRGYGEGAEKRFLSLSPGSSGEEGFTAREGVRCGSGVRGREG
jgi:hypothetical protein